MNDQNHFWINQLPEIGPEIRAALISGSRPFIQRQKNQLKRNASIFMVF
jgi:hypothetical protein